MRRRLRLLMRRLRRLFNSAQGILAWREPYDSASCWHPAPTTLREAVRWKKATGVEDPVLTKARSCPRCEHYARVMEQAV